jgi:4-azaleucine resistance transporter AzlC
MEASDALVSEQLLRASRRQMFLDALGIAASTPGFGLVYGLAARSAGLTVLEVGAMSTFVFAGGAQFAVLGYVSAGAPWLSILVVTALINARHLLYGAALTPYVGALPAWLRAAMAYPLSDETFALAISHFRRIGYADVRGYFLIGIGTEVLPWVVASVIGAALAGSLTDPAVLGLDVVFPAAMAGLAIGLISGRREVVATVTAIVVGIVVALASEPAIGIIAGGVVGPIVGLLMPGAAESAEPEVSAL